MTRERNNGRGKKKSNSKFHETWVSLNQIKDKSGVSIKDIHSVLNEKGFLDKKRSSRDGINWVARYNQTRGRYEWRNSEVTKLVNDALNAGTITRTQPKKTKDATSTKTPRSTPAESHSQRDRHKQVRPEVGRNSSAFKRKAPEPPTPVTLNPEVEQEILRIFKEVEETQRQITGYKIVELSSHSSPYSPYSSKQGLHNDYGYSLANRRPIHIARYKAFADEHGIKHSIDDIICPVCFDDEQAQVPFVYSNRRVGSIHKDGTPYFRHHDYKDFAKNHGAESEWHAAAKDFIRGYVLDFPSGSTITSSENEIRDSSARRVSDVRVEDAEGNVVAFEIQKSRQSDERFAERHSNYSEADIHEQWLYHSGCPKIFGAEDYRHVLILDFVPSPEDETNLVDTTRLGIIVTKMLPGNRYYTFPVSGSELVKKYAIYTPISEWEYSPQGLKPAPDTSAERLVGLLEKMGSLMDAKEALKG